MINKLTFILALIIISLQLNASIYCPADKTVYCDDDIFYLPYMGKATAPTYPPSWIKYKDVNNYNQCRIGNVVRTWYIDMNQDGNFQSTEPNCSQNILLLPIDGDIVINFPPNKTYNCKEEIVKDKPTWITGPCDVLGYNVEESVYEVSDDACYKIFRKFTVINWCTYNHDNPDAGGKWTYTQIIKVIEKNAPVIKNCTNKVIGVDADCKATFVISNNAQDEGTCHTDLLSWNVQIDLWANGTVDYTYGYNENGIFKIEPVANNTEISITLPEKIGPGKHKVHWSVKDQCGNFSSCLMLVETKDLKKPTPYFHQFLTTAFQGDIMDLTISPDCFNIASFDNCTPANELKYSFSSNVNDTIRIVSCDNAGFQFYTIYITDLQGNQEVVDVFMLVFDNGSCNSTFNLSGTITEGNLNPIENARIQLLRNEDAPVVAMSDENGLFVWQDIPLLSDYLIQPQLTEAQSDRIDIADFMMLQNYLLGKDTLVNFEYLAADVNGDQKIRISDLEALRSEILHGKKSIDHYWNISYGLDTIINENNLKSIVSDLNIMDFKGNLDFKAVYAGDITTANSQTVNPRNSVYLKKVMNGTNFDFYLSEGGSFEGLQLEIHVKDLHPAVTLSSSDFSIRPSQIVYDVQKNTIRTLVTEKFNASSDFPLFSINNIRDEDAKTIEITSFSKLLSSEYKTSRLKLNGATGTEHTEVLFPNPGNGIFHWNEAGVEILQVTDYKGQPVPFYTYDRQVEMNVPSGIYFVKVKSNNGIEVKKVVIR